MGLRIPGQLVRTIKGYVRLGGTLYTQQGLLELIYLEFGEGPFIITVESTDKEKRGVGGKAP